MRPINKPIDRFAKELGDEAPLLLLRALKLVPEGAQVALRHLRPETAPPAKYVDLVAALAVEDGVEFVLHLEFCVSFYAEVLRTVARYGGSLACQYDPLRVDSVLVLLDRRRAAKEIPSTCEFANHDTTIRHPFTTVRFWELDPAPILESGDLRFLPWALLMNSDEEQVRQVAAAIRRASTEEATVRFLTLGSFRYHREELESLIGGANMGMMEAILEGSSLVHDLVDRAVEKAEKKGREEGRAETARRLLRSGLSVSFPGLEAHRAVDAITGPDRLEAILLRVMAGAQREEVERLLDQHGR